jgi:hypothetical protein
MLNGQLLVAYADTVGRLAILDEDLDIITTQTFKNFAPTDIKATMLGNGNI